MIGWIFLLACRGHRESRDDDSPSADDSAMPSGDDSATESPDPPSGGLSGDYALADADAKVYATRRDEFMAHHIEVGDVDGNDTPDVFVASELAHGGSGGGHVFYGPLSGTREAEEVGFAGYGSGSMAQAGRSIGMGDVNADGYADIDLGVPYSMLAFVQFGPVTADFDLADSSVRVDGSGASVFGHGSDLADVNGDDVEDLIIGAYGYDARAPTAGSVFIELGPLTAGELMMLDDHDVELYGSSAGLMAGRILTAGTDVSGDGIGDTMIQAFGYDGGAPGSGAVMIAWGPYPSDLDLADADTLLVGSTPNSHAGWAMAQADLDGNGLADVLVGAPDAWGASSTTEPDGEAYVVSSPAAGVMNLAEADVVVHGTHGGYLGLALAAGDLDADGQPELLVGAPFDESGAGATYVFYGAMPGTWDDTDAAARFVGERAGDYSGGGLRVADLDGNDTLDVLIGAPGESTGASGAGAVYTMMSD